MLLLFSWVMLLGPSGDQGRSSLTLWKGRRSQREGELKLNTGVCVCIKMLKALM